MIRNSMAQTLKGKKKKKPKKPLMRRLLKTKDCVKIIKEFGLFYQCNEESLNILSIIATHAQYLQFRKVSAV